MDIKIRLDVEQCDLPIGDMFPDEPASGPLIDEIERRVNQGDLWAWCDVLLTATVTWEGEVFMGRDSIGACSYKDEEDFKKNSGYYEDMKQRAIEEIHKSIAAAVERAFVAAKVRMAMPEATIVEE